jgi:hypothetical protein
MASKFKGTARLRRLNATMKHPQADVAAVRPGKKGHIRTYSEGVPDEIDVVKLRKRLGYR